MIRLPVRVCVLLFLCIVCPVIASAGDWAGRPLREYIEALNEAGLRVIFSSDLVPDSYRVQDEPGDDAAPRVALEKALRPWGLTLAQGPGGTLLVTRLPTATGRLTLQVTAPGAVPIAGADVVVDGRSLGETDLEGNILLSSLPAGQHALTVHFDGYRDAVVEHAVVDAGETRTLELRLLPPDPPLPEIVVTSSRYNLRYQAAGTHRFLDRDLTTRLPDVGDEAVRGILRLPGTTGGGVSTRNHVRGGVQNEQLFRLDGLRLYEPYHLKDFHSVATIVDQNAIAGIDFYSAGYQARYGDRMSGVVDIALREPSKGLHTEIGLSLFNTSLLSMGRFGGHNRGDWMASVRRGNLDLITAIVNPDLGKPRYEDSLVHVGWQWTPRTMVSANVLYSYDKISIATDDGSERGSANYRNGIFWLKAETDWNDRLSSTTIFSTTDIDTTRDGSKDIPLVVSGSVEDSRSFQSTALKQNWEFAASDRWTLRGGFDVKHLDARYQYDSTLAIEAPFDSILDNQPLTVRSFETRPSGAQYAAWFEWRWRPVDRLVLDIGGRWDAQTYTTASDDDQLSPRINLKYKLGPATDLRLAFGQYYQAQEINELQVADGIERYYPAQRALHRVVSVSHRFPAGIDLRFEWYRKSYHTLMPRFENAFDSLVLIPELQIDRVRIDADTARAQGAEVVVTGRHDNTLWWASYAWSESLDRIDGDNVRRSWDQAHTVKAGLNRDYGAWSFSAAGVVHTGWPKSGLRALPLDNADGTTTFDLDTPPRNSWQYSVFHSLDVRVSREFALSRGELTAFLEISNLYNRENPCCTDYRVQEDEAGNRRLLAKGGHWLPLVPSLGIVWRF